VRIAADWIYAGGCVICGRECRAALPLCEICRRRLPVFAEPLCPVCNQFIPGRQSHRNCISGAELPSLLWFSGLFDAGYRPLIHALKYEHERAIGTFFGRRIGRHLQGSLPEDGTTIKVVPVPLHPSRESRRGYNQSGIIAAGVARTIGLPLVEGVLRRVRRTRDQTRLSPVQRIANVTDAFAVIDPADFAGCRVILVDDVWTTGATIKECTRTLAAAGALEVQAVVIALARPQATVS
jgi:ComF family protein